MASRLFVSTALWRSGEIQSVEVGGVPPSDRQLGPITQADHSFAVRRDRRNACGVDQIAAVDPHESMNGERRLRLAHRYPAHHDAVAEVQLDIIVCGPDPVDRRREPRKVRRGRGDSMAVGDSAGP